MSNGFVASGRLRSLSTLFFLVLALSFWLPARTDGALRSGVDSPATTADDFRADLLPPVRYPNNSFLGYRGLVAADINKGNDVSHVDEIVCDFGPLGLWVFELTATYGGTWHQISGADPDFIIGVRFAVASAFEIVADFGVLGLWRWKHGVYPGTWTQISGADADGAFAVDDDCDEGQELQVDFGNLGLWRYDDAGGAGTWHQFSALNPHIGSRMDTYSYGYEEGCWLLPAHGVWRMWWYEGAPVIENLTGTVSLDNDLASAPLTGGMAEDLVVDFGTLGIWLCQRDDHSWHLIEARSARRMREVQFGGGARELLVDVDGDAGLYSWSYAGSYPGVLTQIIPEDLDAGFAEPFDPNGNTEAGDVDEELAVDRGASGLWLYDSTGGTWTILSPCNPDFMVRGDFWKDGYKTALAVDFGSLGLWVYDGRYAKWFQISGHSPDDALYD